jgi:uncharacterized membrane-anchored protein YhcB (DUF1043 family)
MILSVKRLYCIYVSMMLFGCAYASEWPNRELVAVEISDCSSSQVIYSHFKEHESIVDEINSAYNQLVEKTKKAAEKVMSDASQDQSSLWYKINKEKNELEKRSRELPDEIEEINAQKPEGIGNVRHQQAQAIREAKNRKVLESNQVQQGLKYVKEQIRLHDERVGVDNYLQFLANGLKSSSRVPAQDYKDVSEQIIYLRAVLQVINDYYTLEEDHVRFTTAIALSVPEAHEILQKIRGGLGSLETALKNMQEDDVKRLDEHKKQKEKQASLETQLKKETEERQAFHKKFFFGGVCCVLSVVIIYLINMKFLNAYS